MTEIESLNADLLKEREELQRHIHERNEILCAIRKVEKYLQYADDAPEETRLHRNVNAALGSWPTASRISEVAGDLRWTHFRIHEIEQRLKEAGSDEY